MSQNSFHHRSEHVKTVQNCLTLRAKEESRSSCPERLGLTAGKEEPAFAISAAWGHGFTLKRAKRLWLEAAAVERKNFSGRVFGDLLTLACVLSSVSLAAQAAPLAITVQPHSQSVSLGPNVTFRLTASGSPSPAYHRAEAPCSMTNWSPDSTDDSIASAIKRSAPFLGAAGSNNPRQSGFFWSPSLRERAAATMAGSDKSAPPATIVADTDSAYSESRRRTRLAPGVSASSHRRLWASSTQIANLTSTKQDVSFRGLTCVWSLNSRSH